MAGVGHVMRRLCVSALVIARGSCGHEPPARTVTLHDVVASPKLIGQRVRVVGRCSSQLGVPERPARGGETWQFESDGVTVLVVGTLPNPCTAKRESVLTITAVVAEDTLAAIGDLPGAPRRYLVLVDGQ
jgi:hypothetical protein